MNIIRKEELTVEDMSQVEVGDQIQIGRYTATCQKVTDETVIFLLDQYLDKTYQMNHVNSNEGGYEESELRAALNVDFEDDHEFDTVRESLVPFENGDLVRIPTVGEILGPDDFFVMDDAEQWELMKNRLTEAETMEWTWLQNKVKGSSTSFAIVGRSGNAGGNSAVSYFSVWPVIQFAK